MNEFRPEKVFAELFAAEVDYVTVGAFAVIAHGVVRATVDVDFIPDTKPANLERLTQALSRLDAAPDGEPETPVSAALLGRDANMRFQSSAGQIDVLCSETYRHLYPGLRARAIESEVDGVTLVVVSRNDLIRLKAGTGRDRDLVDIGDLLALDE